MIIIEKSMLRFLLAGRTIDITANREHHIGRAYGVRARDGKETYRAEVIASVETPDGYKLTIRQPSYEERPHYLAANPGGIRADYTENPARAAREADGAPIEAATGPRFRRVAASQGIAAHIRPGDPRSISGHVRSATIRLRDAAKRDDSDSFRSALEDLATIQALAFQSAGTVLA